MNSKTDALSMTPRLWLELVLLSALWGGSFLFGRIASQELPAFTLAFSRVLIAAAALWLFFLLTRRKLPGMMQLALPILLLGLMNNAIPFTLIFWGQQQIGAGLASILNAMTPVWTLLLAPLLSRDEKITPGKAAGIVLGFGGVALLLADELAPGLAGPVAAKLAVLGASASYAFAAVFAKRFRGIDPVFVAAGQLTASAMILALPALLIDGAAGLLMPTPKVLLAVLALALACTAFAYVLFFRILARAGATNVSLVTLLIPVSALVLGAIFLGEQLSLNETAGMALVASALLFIDGRAMRALRRGR